MEDRHHGEVDSLSEQLHVCESVLSEEKRLHTATQQEVSRLNQELEACRDDSLQEKSSLLEQIKVSLHVYIHTCVLLQECVSMVMNRES